MGSQFIFLVRRHIREVPIIHHSEESMTDNSDDSNIPMRGTERVVSTGDAPALLSEDAHLTFYPQH